MLAHHDDIGRKSSASIITNDEIDRTKDGTKENNTKEGEEEVVFHAIIIRVRECADSWTRTSEARRRQIYSLLVLPLTDTGVMGGVRLELPTYLLKATSPPASRKHSPC